jgi:signal transduction histidine kinase
MHIKNQFNTRWIRYVVATASVLLAGALSLCLPWSQVTPSPLFAVAVVLSAWFGGRGPGIYSALLSAVTWQAIFVSEAGPVDWEDLLQIVTFLIAGVVVGTLVARLRRQRELLAESNELLEQRVAERTAELQKTAKFWEDFCYSIAHDLRAPLRAIHGYTEMLTRQEGPISRPPQNDYAGRVLEAAERMDRLILDLLEYGALSQKVFTKSPVDLAVEVDRLLARLESRITAQQASVTVQCPLPTISADASLVADMLRSLISNALKFVPDGVRPKINIRAEVNGQKVRVWVEDNGIGIAPEFQEKIFHLFQRLHNDTDYPGTGVGLAFVSKGAEKLGGRAGVQSQPGQGSRFWIELPKV